MPFKGKSSRSFNVGGLFIGGWIVAVQESDECPVGLINIKKIL
jgi:hypothetical protein